MNNIITLDQLAAEFAKRANISVDEAREIILSLQHDICSDLAGESAIADVRHIGKFQVADMSTGEVSFTPDKTIAEIINEPFSFFEPVEVFSDQLDTVETKEEIEATAEIETTVQPDIAETTTVVEEQLTKEQPEAAPVPVHYHYTIPADDNKPSIDATPESTQPASQPEPVYTEPEPQAEPQPKHYSDEVEDIEEYEPRHSMNPIVAYILGILTGMILMCIAVYFLYPPLNLSDDDEIYPIDEDITVITDSTKAAVTDPADKPSDEPAAPVTTNTQPTTPKPAASGNKIVTDTVSSTNYLAIMARKYYGNTEFWVYIYQENEAILGHPDRVPAGTVVVIPPASKYGIDANDPESIKRAKKLNGPIYAPYK